MPNSIRLAYRLQQTAGYAALRPPRLLRLLRLLRDALRTLLRLRLLLERRELARAPPRLDFRDWDRLREPLELERERLREALLRPDDFLDLLGELTRSSCCSSCCPTSGLMSSAIATSSYANGMEQAT